MFLNQSVNLLVIGETGSLTGTSWEQQGTCKSQSRVYLEIFVRRFSSQILAFQSLPRSTDLAAVGSGRPVLAAGRDNFRDSFCSG